MRNDIISNFLVMSEEAIKASGAIYKAFRYLTAAATS